MHEEIQPLSSFMGSTGQVPGEICVKEEVVGNTGAQWLALTKGPAGVGPYRSGVYQAA